MKAIVINNPGGPEVLKLGEVADPVPTQGELLVRVRASALNRADILQRLGGYAPPPGASEILGLEMAGEVLEGDGEFKPGDRVMALLPGGGYAELVTIPAGMAIPIPEKLSFEEAAALPEAGLTAYMNLFMLGDLKAGNAVLVHAAGSGVGTVAIQLAKAAGVTVLATAGSPAKLEAAQQLGADFTLNYKDQRNFSRWALESTGGNGVDLILDFVGGPYLGENLKSLAMNGRLVLIGQMGGGKTEIDLGYVMRRRLHILGTTLRAQPVENKIELTRRFRNFALPLLEQDKLKPVVDKVFNLSEAEAAHRYMEASANTGKIVLRVP